MRLRPFSIAFSLALVSGCGSKPPQDLRVMSYAPTGPTERDEPVELHFDKPAVSEAMVGKPALPGSVRIVPQLEWKGFWQDRQTLVLEPTQPLAPSTRYSVSLAGELATRTADFGFSFVNRPLAVEGVWGVDPDAIAPDGEVPVSFNQPVQPADAAAHCKLTGAHGEVALAAAPNDRDAATNVTLHPVAKLAPGTGYTLACAGLTGAGGNTPLAQPYALAIRARPLLAVTSISPQGTDVSADDVTLTFAFTTPVALDAARKAVSAKPAIAGLDRGSLSSDGTEYSVTADLETETDYSLKLAGLVDRFGQKLDKPVVATFHTGNAQPRLSMERGIFTLEASAKGYPVWSRNVHKMEIECAAIPKDRIARLLTTDMNYDPWGGNDDDKPLDWRAIKAKPKTKQILQPAKDKWVLSEVDLGATCGATAGKRGVYLAEVHSDEVHEDDSRPWLSARRNRVLANVTDLGVLIKVGPASGIVWVTSLSTGLPVEGATVAVQTPQGKRVFTGTTDRDGLVKVPGSALLKQQPATGAAPDPEADEDWDSYRSQRLIATVEKGDDLAIVDGNWANGIQTWNFGLPEDRGGGVTRVRGFIESDRGLYRAGEQVHFKGIVREIAGGAPPRIPGKPGVAIEVQDSRGQVVLTTKTKLSSFGGFAFDMQLADDASLGDYYVAATVAGQVFRERFEVQEFRPAAFEVGLARAGKQPKPIRPGERMAFDLDATYLFGAPVASAKVEWSVRKRKHVVTFPGFEDYAFSADPRDGWWWSRRDDYGELVSDESGATDDRGHLELAARDANPSKTDPTDYIVSATVTDATDQSSSKSVIVTAHPTSLYIGMHANEMVQAVGMPFGVNLAAFQPDGTRTATKLHLSFIRTANTCGWDSVGIRSYESCTATDTTMIERDVEVAAGGSHTERIYPTEPGDYVVKAEAKDDAGRPVITESEIWVIGKGEAFWSGDEGDRMTLIASKPTYQIGETAKLVAQANLPHPTALVTIERDGVLDARVIKMASAGEGVEVPIVDGFAPNVFASVVLVSGRDGEGDAHRPKFKMGVVELAVSSAKQELAVDVTIANDHVEPGQKVIGKIHVSRDGKPVKAEVAVSAADEGVLQLIAYATPNPMKTFYAAYGLGVDSATSWNRLARLADPQAGDPDQGGDMRARGGQKVRSKFVASAFWAPMLVTDDHGDAPFEFAAPDNLTAYRVMAVAADAGAQFGAGEHRVTIDKPVMAQPILPRFLRADDSATIGVEVFNHTGKAGVAIVTASGNGAALDHGRERVDVPANGSARVRFVARASQNAAASFDFVATIDGAKDAVRVTLPIEKPRVIDTHTLADQTLADGGSWTGTLGLTPDVIREDSTLTVTVDRTGVGALAPALRALVAYPYGCLEQTLSRFLPLVAAKDLATALDDPALQGTKLEQFITAGVAKVIRHQQGDGLFSLWPQSQTYPELSAYALYGLTVAQQAGVSVPADVFTRGIKAIDTWATAKALAPDGDAAALAMAAYVMALRGKPDAPLVARLYAIRAGMPTWGQAFLLRALAVGKGDAKQIAELEQQIVGAAVVKDGRAMIHESSGPDVREHYMDSDVRATAMTLAALLDADPASPLVDPLAAGLLSARSDAGSWQTTQDDVWSLVALARYAKRVPAGDSTATIMVDDKQVSRKRLVGRSPSVTTLRLDRVAGDRISVAVDHGAKVSVRVAAARRDTGAAASAGYAIARDYVDPHGKQATTFKAGDLLTVEVEIDASAKHSWVAVVDPLPAGFEIVNDKLATSGAGDDAPSDPWDARWNAPTWSYQELRDDSARWFADELPAGHYHLTYQVRATIAGSFTAPPASVEAMYEPDVHGRSAATAISISR